LVLPVPTKHAFDDRLTLSGQRNHVQMDATTLAGGVDGKPTVFLCPGTHVQITLSHAEGLLQANSSALNKLVAFDVSEVAQIAGTTQVSWTRDASGTYQFIAKHSSGMVEPIRFSITLDQENPMVHAAFQAGLDKSLLIVNGQQEARAEITRAPGELQALQPSGHGLGHPTAEVAAGVISRSR